MLTNNATTENILPWLYLNAVAPEELEPGTPPTPHTNTAVSACPECNGTDATCDLCVEIARPTAQPNEVES